MFIYFYLAWAFLFSLPYLFYFLFHPLALVLMIQISSHKPPALHHRMSLRPIHLYLAMILTSVITQALLSCRIYLDFYCHWEINCLS